MFVCVCVFKVLSGRYCCCHTSNYYSINYPILSFCSVLASKSYNRDWCLILIVNASLVLIMHSQPPRLGGREHPPPTSQDVTIRAFYCVQLTESSGRSVGIGNSLPNGTECVNETILEGSLFSQHRVQVDCSYHRNTVTVCVRFFTTGGCRTSTATARGEQYVLYTSTLLQWNLQ